MALNLLYFMFIPMLIRKASGAGTPQKSWTDAVAACGAKGETLLSLDQRNCSVLDQFAAGSFPLNFVWTGEYLSQRELSVDSPLVPLPVQCFAYRRSKKQPYVYSRQCSNKLQYACKRDDDDICIELECTSESGKHVCYFGNNPRLINVTIKSANYNCDYGDYGKRKDSVWVKAWCRCTFSICYTEEMNVEVIDDPSSWANAAVDCAREGNGFLLDQDSLLSLDPNIFQLGKLIWIGTYGVWNIVEELTPNAEPVSCLSCVRTNNGWEPREDFSCNDEGRFICEQGDIEEMTTDATMEHHTTATLSADVHSEISTPELDSGSNTPGMSDKQDLGFKDTIYVIVGVIIVVVLMIVLIIAVMKINKRKMSSRKQGNFSMTIRTSDAKLDRSVETNNHHLTAISQSNDKCDTRNRNYLEVNSINKPLPSPVYFEPIDLRHVSEHNSTTGDRESVFVSHSETSFYNVPDDSASENFYSEVDGVEGSQTNVSRVCHSHPPSPLYKNVETHTDDPPLHHNASRLQLPANQLSMNINVNNNTPSNYVDHRNVPRLQTGDDYNKLNEVAKPTACSGNVYDHVQVCDDMYDKVRFKSSDVHNALYGNSTSK